MTDETSKGWRRHFAVIDALRDYPKLPSPLALALIGNAAVYDDHAVGVKIQIELGLDRIPPNYEAEAGAGLWDRITNGTWREAE